MHEKVKFSLFAHQLENILVHRLFSKYSNVQWPLASLDAHY